MSNSQHNSTNSSSKGDQKREVNAFKHVFDTLFFDDRDNAKKARLRLSFVHHRKSCDERVEAKEFIPIHPMQPILDLLNALCDPSELFALPGDLYTVRMEWQADIAGIKFNMLEVPQIKLRKDLTLRDIFMLGKEAASPNNIMAWESAASTSPTPSGGPSTEVVETFSVEQGEAGPIITAETNWRGKLYTVIEDKSGIQIFKLDGDIMSSNSVPWKGVVKEYRRLKSAQ